MFESEIGKLLGIPAAPDARSSEDLLRKITGVWRTTSGSLIEVKGNGEAVLLEESGFAAASGYKSGDVIFRNAHVVGGIIEADGSSPSNSRTCPRLGPIILPTAIRVSSDGNTLTETDTLYRIDKDAKGNCTKTDKVERYALFKWTRVGAR